MFLSLSLPFSLSKINKKTYPWLRIKNKEGDINLITHEMKGLTEHALSSSTDNA